MWRVVAGVVVLVVMATAAFAAEQAAAFCWGPAVSLFVIDELFGSICVHCRVESSVAHAWSRI